MVIGTRNSGTREQWLETTLRKIPSGMVILDAGAGELAYKKFCDHLTYVSQDFCKYNGIGDNRALQHGKWDTSRIDIVSDIAQIPKPGESFDAIMCIEVLEHIPDPVSAIKELSRLLKKGGYLILTAPFCSRTHQSPFHFYSGFNRYFYQRYLETFGLEILEISENGNFFEYLAQEIQHIPNVVNKYCKKEISIGGRFVMWLMLRLLSRFNAEDSGSKEELCFGYHIFAKKK